MNRKPVIQFIAVLFIIILIQPSFRCTGPNRDGLYDLSDSYLELTDRLWRLEQYEATDGSIYRPDSSEIYTLEFNEDLTLVGNFECNDCFGSYEPGPDDQITLSLICTDLACDTRPENPLPIYYLPSLYGAVSYEIQCNQLRFHYRYIYRKGILYEGNLLFSDNRFGISPNVE